MGFIRNSVKSLFNVRAWVSYDHLKAGTRSLFQLGRGLLVPKKSTTQESFEQAKARLDLDDEKLDAKANHLFRIAILFVVFAIALLGYALYHAMKGHWLATLISFSLTFLMLSLAFRYHFWFFQIKHKKLGCSFSEWMNAKVDGRIDAPKK